MSRPNFRWWEWAECAGTDTTVFFESSRVDEAKAICGRCVVRASCRREAMEETALLLADDDGHLDFGVKGGLTPEERQRIISDLSCYSETDTGTVA